MNLFVVSRCIAGLFGVFTLAFFIGVIITTLQLFNMYSILLAVFWTTVAGLSVLLLIFGALALILGCLWSIGFAITGNPKWHS